MQKSSITKTDEKYIINAFKKGHPTYQELADYLGKSKNAIAIHCLRKLKINKGTHKKHADISLKVMEFFIDHTAEETQKKFRLTKSEFKSLCTSFYQKEKYKDIRKDKCREHSSFTEYRELAMYLGLLSRQEITIKLNRGYSFHAVKDRIKKGNFKSKHMNGLNLSKVQPFFDKPLRSWKTHCGPGFFKFIIVPWVEMEDKIDHCILSNEFKSGIISLAKYQRFIFQVKTNQAVKAKITRILK